MTTAEQIILVLAVVAVAIGISRFTTILPERIAKWIWIPIAAAGAAALWLIAVLARKPPPTTPDTTPIAKPKPVGPTDGEVAEIVSDAQRLDKEAAKLDAKVVAAVDADAGEQDEAVDDPDAPDLSVVTAIADASKRGLPPR